MKWTDIISQAFSNLMRRKTRSALTMLGVVLGTAVIVITFSLGFGAEKTQMEALEGYANLRMINVYPYYGGYSDSNSTNTNRITKITDGVISRIRRIEGVDAVTPMQSIWFGAEAVITTGKMENQTSIMAVLPKDFAKIRDLKEGKYFSSNVGDTMEFIMSGQTMMEFQNPDEEMEWVDTYSLLMEGKELPLDDKKIKWLRDKYTFQLRWEEVDEDSTDQDAEPKIITKDYKAKMVGILTDDMNDWYFSYGAIVNLNWIKRLESKDKKLLKELGWTPITSYDQLYVLADSTESVENVVRDLNEMGLQPNSMMATVAQFKQQIQTMQMFLGFIGFISMAVAALMIANTMLMSIYERTREIGVMKVLGCKMGNIRMMFLSEAAFIGVIGGAVGLLVSYLISFALNNVPALQQVVMQVMSSNSYLSNEGGTASIIPAYLALVTWLGATLISIASGILPAQRAMRLSSLAAIRSAE
ncbi:ABC transporter permease [Eubacteriales bacterium OttesenSCG-928-N13]|nr:ABC transporter permease [Eubacteriales bacterium OttesenSCG-928-N13]